MDELTARWRATVLAAGATDPAGADRAGERLLAGWREPHRRYHDEEHLRAVLDVVDAYADQLQPVREQPVVAGPLRL
ncbi:hypothetical protein ACISRB_30270, partial [Micromonospora aurantiaca]